MLQKMYLLRVCFFVLVTIITFSISCERIEEPEEEFETEEVFIPKPYSGDLLISTASELSELHQFYEEGYNIINGSLGNGSLDSINKDTLSNQLKYLSNIVDIEESLDISCNGIDSFNYLPNLKHVGRVVNIRSRSLKKVNLPKLHRIDDKFEIVGQSLESVSCSSLEAIGSMTSDGTFLISFSGIDETIISFPKLKDIDYILAYNCPGLEFIKMDSINSIEVIDLLDCNSITSFDWIPNLLSMHGFQVNKCGSIQNFSGLDSISSLNYIYIRE